MLQMNAEQFLLEKYGPVLSLSQLAGLLDRSTDGLRLSLLSNSDLSRKLNPARLKIGRRVYFQTLLVARVITGGTD
jgi:hypothetical protein